MIKTDGFLLVDWLVFALIIGLTFLSVVYCFVCVTLACVRQPWREWLQRFRKWY